MWHLNFRQKAVVVGKINLIFVEKGSRRFGEIV
jgi:hypothetical protein